MHTHSDSRSNDANCLQHLATRARGGDKNAQVELRERLCDSLGPIVRLALRRGVGLPPLVRWTKGTAATLAEGDAAPPEQQASAIAQLLCRELLHGVPPEQPRRPRAADTVRMA